MGAITRLTERVEKLEADVAELLAAATKPRPEPKPKPRATKG